MHADKVFQQFSSRFVGKVSPVHFFWGSFDLAVTRFSGRPAPPREGADASDARGLFARSDQCRLLAGQWGLRRSRFLLLRRPGAQGP